jgi:hypothetical protein
MSQSSSAKQFDVLSQVLAAMYQMKQIPGSLLYQRKIKITSENHSLPSFSFLFYLLSADEILFCASPMIPC